MSSKIKFVKIRDVKTPVRGTQFSAGIDFFVPVMNETVILDMIKENKENLDLKYLNQYINSDESPVVTLKPLERIKIPSGLCCLMSSENSALIANDKSGVSTIHGITRLAGVVDYDYRGEIWICVVNVSNEVVNITPNMKLMQFIETPIIISDIEMVDKEYYSNYLDTIRGKGGFGHTGK